MKRLAIIILLAAACGSSNPPPPAQPAAPAATTAPASTGLLGIGEIAIKDNGKDVLLVHANGDIQFADEGGWKSIGKIDSSGKMTATDNQTGQLQADGTFTTPEGPAPFKLDGAALVAGSKRVTIENGKLVGLGDRAAAEVTITGADTDATKRTALLIFGLLMSASASEKAEGAGSAVTAPAK